ncbi:MAG: hypothetical protein DWQ01_18140 [Planctomycetota bacterium]|nr:MAG: hypothetical protein DWQ01_18140 [Planctomycetota bacterium]
MSHPLAVAGNHNSDLSSKEHGFGDGQVRSAHPWVHRLAWLGILATLLLPFVSGGTVTSLDVGMAVPDWPTTFQQNMFTVSIPELRESGGVGAVVEHGHRLAGAAIGFFAMFLAAVCLLQKSLPKSWKWLSLAILALVIVQGLIGGLRVLENERAIAIFHAVGAQVVLIGFAAMAKLSSPAWTRSATHPESLEGFESGAVDRLRLWTGTALAVLFVHLWAGAGLRHQQASLSGHLILAGVVTLVLMVVIHLGLTQFYRLPRLLKAIKALVSLLGLQLALGLATWAFKHGPESVQAGVGVHAPLATLHLVFGAGLVAVVAGLTLEAWIGPLAQKAQKEKSQALGGTA